MAATTRSRDHRRIDDRRTLASIDEWTPTLATAGLILAAAFVLGAVLVGVAIAGLFVLGNLVVAADSRTLGAEEFALISALHVAATVAVGLSF